MLPFVSPTSGHLLHQEGDVLLCEDERYPIINGIPRFVDSKNYAASFGLQWKTHTKTQLDSYLGTHISRERLERCLGTPLAELAGKTVLEAGCGAGRFTELLVAAGAKVHAIDLSVAVEANRENIGGHEHYVVAQASLLTPPFPPGAFDAVICLGVLQHLPSPEDGIRALWSMVKPGGWLIIDHYTWSLSYVTKLSNLYRLVLRRMAAEKAKRITDWLVDLFFPIHWALRKIYPAQMLLSRVSPCLVYFRLYPHLTKEQHYEWTRLDTFDHLTDYYKHMRTSGEINTCLRSLGAINIAVWRGGNGIEARAQKPQ